MIDKERLLAQIIDQLNADLRTAMAASAAAHAAAINTETQPDNKYDTLSLESSYIAQGHANRAQQLRLELNAYRKLVLVDAGGEPQVIMTSIVAIQYESGMERLLFIGPASGGMKLECDGKKIVIITPESPLCQSILGRETGDMVALCSGANNTFEIISIC